MLPRIEGYAPADLEHIRSAFAMNHAQSSLALRIKGPDSAFDFVLEQLEQRDLVVVRPEVDREQFRAEYKYRPEPTVMTTAVWRVYAVLERSLDEQGVFVIGSVNSCDVVACDGQIVSVAHRWSRHVAA